MENWTGSLIKRKNEFLTTNKLNYVCQEVECTQQAKGSALNSRSPWEGLFSGLSFIFLPGLCDRADLSTPRWLLTRVRSRERILHWPQAPPHQLQWHLHPPAELLRLITHFTHSCKASRQGQVWSPISCVCDRSQQWDTSCNSMLSTLGVNPLPCLLLIRRLGTSWLKVSSQRGHKCPLLRLTPFLRSFSPW